MGGANHRFAGGGGGVMGFAREVGNINETRGDFISAAGLAHAIFEHGGESAAVEGIQIFFFG